MNVPQSHWDHLVSAARNFRTFAVRPCFIALLVFGVLADSVWAYGWYLIWVESFKLFLPRLASVCLFFFFSFIEFLLSHSSLDSHCSWITVQWSWPSPHVVAHCGESALLFSRCNSALICSLLPSLVVNESVNKIVPPELKWASL